MTDRDIISSLCRLFQLYCSCSAYGRNGKGCGRLGCRRRVSLQKNASQSVKGAYLEVASSGVSGLLAGLPSRVAIAYTEETGIAIDGELDVFASRWDETSATIIEGDGADINITTTLRR